MSWLSSVTKDVLKGFDHSLSKLTTAGQRDSLFEDVKQYGKDFKDWFDGTAAMEKQNALNIQNWEMQNAYNTPEAQMQRYLAAGLNPNLIYGQSNMAGGIAGVSMPHTGAETMSKAMSILSSFYNIGALIANVKNLQQQNHNLMAQESLSYAQGDFVREQARRYALDTDYLERNGLSTFSPRWPRNIMGTLDLLKQFFDFEPVRSEFHKTYEMKERGDSSYRGARWFL